MNQRKQSMQNVLRNYRKSVQNFHEKLSQARQELNTEAYKKREAELKAALEKEKESALSIIKETADAARKEALAWSKLDGSKITDDAKLLTYGDVSPEQFRELVDRYKDNGTMCQILANYANKKNAEIRESSRDPFPSGLYNTTEIPTSSQKIHEIDHTEGSARSIMNMIEGGFLGGPNSTLVESAINEFVK